MNALLLVDLQCDFLPGGALPVSCGDEVIEIANRLQPRFDLVVASQDWHPADHQSFAANHPGKQPGDEISLGGDRQVLWPVHCVQGTPGAELAPALEKQFIRKTFAKGVDSQIDSYSAFFDNGHLRSTGLGEYLREQGVDEVYILGLATDYCVKATALNAVELGFKTYLIEDACRGVNLRPGDVARALDEMQAAGVRVIRSDELK